MKRRNGAPLGEIDWPSVRKRVEQAGIERVLTREEKDAILVERARALTRPLELATERGTDVAIATFMLSSERYGIDARLVIEITRLADFTALPHAPVHLVGVTNLRGEILPVFDLRALLGLNRRSLNDLTRLVVLGQARPEFGILADSTRELVFLGDRHLLPPPESVSEQGRHYMRGVTKDALVVLDGKVLLEDPRLFCDQGEDAARYQGRAT
jgi:purine-binding chemotaxis protein CheW